MSLTLTELLEFTRKIDRFTIRLESIYSNLSGLGHDSDFISTVLNVDDSLLFKIQNSLENLDQTIKTFRVKKNELEKL